MNCFTLLEKTLLVVLVLTTVKAIEDEDNVGEIILHGTERPLSATDRIAILQAKEQHVKYRLISTGEECALKKFVKSRYAVIICF